jgi:DeoR/GlpR family transcriptional regulator of sugar metabolism
MRRTEHIDAFAFEMRLRHARDSKRAIARAVAPVVRDGDVIAIDSSTSTYYLAQELLERRNLVVITNGLRHALLFMEHSTAMVLLPGGVVRRSAGSVVGPIGDVLAGRGRITAGFFGVVSVSTIHGLMDISAEEAHTKQFMAQACDTVYGLFDSSKVNGFGLHSFTPSTDITAMYTDDGATSEFVDQWRDLGVPLTTVPVSAADARVVEIGVAAPNRRQQRVRQQQRASP